MHTHSVPLHCAMYHILKDTLSSLGYSQHDATHVNSTPLSSVLYCELANRQTQEGTVCSLPVPRARLLSLPSWDHHWWLARSSWPLPGCPSGLFPVPAGEEHPGAEIPRRQRGGGWRRGRPDSHSLSYWGEDERGGLGCPAKQGCWERANDSSEWASLSPLSSVDQLMKGGGGVADTGTQRQTKFCPFHSNNH